MKHCEAKMSTCIKHLLFFFLMLFCCLLPFASHICDVSSIQFDSNTHLSFNFCFIHLCLVVLFVCCFSFCSVLCVCTPQNIYIIFISHTAIVPPIYNSQFKISQKIINIRLKWLTLLFCFWLIHSFGPYNDEHGCRGAVAYELNHTRTHHIHCTPIHLKWIYTEKSLTHSTF